MQKNGVNALKSYQTCLFTFLYMLNKNYAARKNFLGPALLTNLSSDTNMVKMKKKVPVVFLCLCQKVFSSRPHWLPPPGNHCYCFFVFVFYADIAFNYHFLVVCFVVVKAWHSLEYQLIKKIFSDFQSFNHLLAVRGFPTDRAGLHCTWKNILDNDF